MKTPNLLKTLSLNLVIIMVSAELVSMAYVSLFKPYLGYMESYPTYLKFDMEDRYMPYYDPLGPHFIDTTYPWSTWHPRNSRFRHRHTCYDVMMEFNSEGTRGLLPDPTDSSTVLFIGDSYTEGYGLSEEYTVPSVYSRLSGKPTLNLGCSGYIGTTQQSLIYEYFAERYRHKKVYVIMFLSNDFSENDILNYRRFFGPNRRYRPYRGDTSDLSRIVYMGSPDSSKYNWTYYREIRASRVRKRLSMGMKSYLSEVGDNLPSKIYNLTYLCRAVKVIQNGLNERIPTELRHTERDLAILDHDIRSIMRTADKHGVQVTFLNLPDIKMFTNKRKDGIEERYLALESHISGLLAGSRHRYISFFKHLKESKVDIFNIIFECDPHFNEVGAEMLATFLNMNP